MVINNFLQSGTLTCTILCSFYISLYREILYSVRTRTFHKLQEMGEQPQVCPGDTARVLWHNLLAHIHSFSWPKGKFFPFPAEIFGGSSGLVDFFGRLEAQRVLGGFLTLGQALESAVHTLHHHLHLLQFLLCHSGSGPTQPLEPWDRWVFMEIWPLWGQFWLHIQIKGILVLML